MSDTEVFSTAEAAEATGGDYPDLLAFAREHELPRVGTAYVWTDEDVSAYLDACDEPDHEDDDEDDDEGDEDEDDDDDDE